MLIAAPTYEKSKNKRSKEFPTLEKDCSIHQDLNKIKKGKIFTCQKLTCGFTASIKYLPFGNKTKLFLSSFPIANTWFHFLAQAFRNNYVSACSTARRSATEKNVMSGYGTVPCLAKMLKHSSTADWIRL